MLYFHYALWYDITPKKEIKKLYYKRKEKSQKDQKNEKISKFTPDIIASSLKYLVDGICIIYKVHLIKACPL